MDKLTITTREFQKYVELTFSARILDNSDYDLFKGISQVLYELLLKFGVTEYSLDFIISEIRNQQYLKLPRYNPLHEEFLKTNFKTFGT